MAVSRDLTSALGFVVLVAVISGTVARGFAGLLDLFRRSLGVSMALPASGQPAHIVAAGVAALRTLTPLLMVPVGAVMAVGVLVGATQTGGLFSWQAAIPDVTRLSPAAGLRRLVGPHTVVEIGKGLLKIVVVLVIAANVLVPAVSDVSRLAGARPASVLAAMGIFAQRLGLRVAFGLVVLGTLDWLLARRRHRKSLMMTREEVKREHKDVEGDPRHKIERRRLHREMAEQRTMGDIPKAAFVVVNPEHIAVAVKYDRDSGAAPIVLAKGGGLLAERIKQVARESAVPIYRDAGLARALAALPEGEEIPEILYEAVAELLRGLWQTDQPRRVAPTAAATRDVSEPWAPGSA